MAPYTTTVTPNDSCDLSWFASWSLLRAQLLTKHSVILSTRSAMICSVQLDDPVCIHGSNEAVEHVHRHTGRFPCRGHVARVVPHLAGMSNV